MKPLRPFPFPLNVGTDICHISRIYTILNGPRASRFVNRVLAPEELLWNEKRLRRCLNNGSSLASERGSFVVKGGSEAPAGGGVRDAELWKTAAFVAGRFAAKEAAIKAHSHRRLTFHDVVIERRGRTEDRLGSGPPVARIKGLEGTGVDESAVVSISHDGEYATAVCLGYDLSVTERVTGSM